VLLNLVDMIQWWFNKYVPLKIWWGILFLSKNNILNLNIKGMLKNKYLSKSIQELSLNRFLNINQNGIIDIW